MLQQRVLLRWDRLPSVTFLAVARFVQVQRECVAMVMFITDFRKGNHFCFDLTLGVHYQTTGIPRILKTTE